MKPRRISAVDHNPLDLRAAHPNVTERAVIERMKLAYRRDVGALDGIGAPPFAGRGDNRLGKGAHDGRSAAGSGLKRAQAGAAGGRAARASRITCWINRFRRSGVKPL